MEEKILAETKETLLTIADTLYQGNVSEGIASMQSVIPNLSVIASAITDEEMQQRLITEALSPILSAMEEEDGTLLADLITYELVEILDVL